MNAVGLTQNILSMRIKLKIIDNKYKRRQFIHLQNVENGV